MKKERKTTSIKVSPELWEEVKIHCIRQKIDISDWLENIIKENLKKKTERFKSERNIKNTIK